MSRPTPHTPTDDSIDAPALTRERERFNWFAQRLQRWLGSSCVDQLCSFLDAISESSRLVQRKKALVLLALSGEPDAVEALEAFDPTGESEPFQLLYRVALEQVDSNLVN